MTRTTDLDGERVVAAVWGIDGPYTADQLAEAMLALQHLTRWSNHATFNASRTVLPEPGDVATVARRLGDAVGGLPQLLDQLAARCSELATEPALRAGWNGPDDPRQAAAVAAAELRAVGAAAAGLRQGLQRAGAVMDSLYRDDDEDEHR